MLWLIEPAESRPLSTQSGFQCTTGAKAVTNLNTMPVRHYLRRRSSTWIWQKAESWCARESPCIPAVALTLPSSIIEPVRHVALCYIYNKIRYAQARFLQDGVATAKHRGDHRLFELRTSSKPGELLRFL